MYSVYILANRRNGTLYVGVTNDLPRRIHEHKDGVVAGFTRTHDVKHLVHYEVFDDVTAAIAREKQLKRWRRRWKLELIESGNPDWQDLYELLSPSSDAPLTVTPNFSGFSRTPTQASPGSRLSARDDSQSPSGTSAPTAPPSSRTCWVMFFHHFVVIPAGEPGSS